MFEWIRKHRIKKLAAKAGQYAEEHFTKPETEVWFSAEPEDPSIAKHRPTARASIEVPTAKKDKAKPEQKPAGRASIEVPAFEKEEPLKPAEHRASSADSVHKARFQVFEIDTWQDNDQDNYDGETIQKTIRSISSATPVSRILRELDDNTNKTFVDKMLEHISRRHMKDADVYKAAQVDRRLFSKIVSDREYKPAKDTCVAFAFALKLTLPEAEDLLSRAGYTLSHSSKRDVVIEYFFKEHIYNLNDVNGVLYQLQQDPRQIKCRDKGDQRRLAPC